MLIHSPQYPSQFAEHKPRFSTLCKTINPMCAYTHIYPGIQKNIIFLVIFLVLIRLHSFVYITQNINPTIFIKNLSRIKFADKNFRNWFSFFLLSLLLSLFGTTTVRFLLHMFPRVVRNVCCCVLLILYA